MRREPQVLVEVGLYERVLLKSLIWFCVLCMGSAIVRNHRWKMN